MSTHKIQFHDKKISLNICFLELAGLKTEFELAMVNEPSVVELHVLRFDCIYIPSNMYTQRRLK